MGTRFRLEEGTGRQGTKQVKKRFSKADLILIVLLLVIGVCGLLFVNAKKKQAGATVQVFVDRTLYGTYELSKDQTVPIQAHGAVTNTLQISDGKAKMVQADCPDQLCVHQRAVSARGETIVCLPNKVVAEVKGEQEAAFDSISR